MKHLSLFEDYMDKLGDVGAYHNVYDIDNDWILKMPKPVERGESEYSILDFDHHINTMKEFPEIFPAVKRLSKKRAAIEKLDTEAAKKDIEIISKLIHLKLAEDKYAAVGAKLLPSPMLLPRWIISEIYDIPVLQKILRSIPEEICQRWTNFLDLIRLKLGDYPLQNNLDLHNGNFGIDREGNIKLLDF